MPAPAPDDIAVRYPRNRIFYLTAPPGVREFGTWCVTAGDARTLPGDQYPPDELRHPHRYRAVSAEGRVLDELQIVFVAEGKGEFENDRGDVSRVRHGDCLVLLPGLRHRYHPDPGTGWREYWVGVRGDAAARAVRLLEIDAHAPISRPGLAGALITAYERLLELASIHDTVAHVEMVSLVLHLIALVSRPEAPPESGRREPDRVETAIARMHAQLYGRLRLSDLARECGLSDAGFRRLFRARTGSSPYRYYMALKVNAVKKELAHSALPLKAIAGQLGFTDQYHLSRVFREYTGVAPSVWRRRGG
ncbi:MAG: helix-turn-helix domain-containing protein [Spirochaetota bacterium]